MKPARQQRVGRIMVTEIVEKGKPVLYIDGVRHPGNFHEAVVAAKQAPLLEMRDRCRDLAAKSKAHREEALKDLEE